MLLSTGQFFNGGGGGGGGGAGPTPVYRHHNFMAVDGSTETLDVAYPTGLAANDIMLLAVAYDPVGGTGVSLNTPSGFTIIGTEQTTPNGKKTSLFWKRATGSESGNLTVTLAGTMAASRIFTATLAAYSGCLQSASPIDDYSETALNGSPTMGAITTTGANRCCLSFFLETTNDNAIGTGPTSGWTTRGNNTSAVGFDSAIFFFDIEQASAGSPALNAITVSGSQDFGVHAFGLMPEPA